MFKSISSFILIFWAGFVCSISFMEAWLKFRAPGITLPLGLGIGKIVFTALNRMEWLFFILVAGHLLLSKNIRIPLQPFVLNVFFAIVAGILLLQTFVLLPGLVERSNKIINNQPVESSFIHLFYIVAELVKVSLLIIAAFMVNKQFVKP